MATVELEERSRPYWTIIVDEPSLACSFGVCVIENKIGFSKLLTVVASRPGGFFSDSFDYKSSIVELLRGDAVTVKSKLNNNMCYTPCEELSL